MIKVILSTSLTFNNREELVNELIEIINDQDLTNDESYQEYVPANWDDPNGWSDEDLTNFIANCGNFLVYNHIDSEELFQDWINETSVLVTQ